MNLVGQRFGRLTVLSREQRNLRGRLQWVCICDCGRKVVILEYNLRDGNSKSCGCGREVSHRKHGLRKAPEYRLWQNMVQRCGNPNNPRYDDYGGRGIRVCARWRKSFAAFYADVGPRPSAKHSIDRIDNDGNYEPGNVRWATAYQQVHNRRPKGAPRAKAKV